jgi:hypothetical protein
MTWTPITEVTQYAGISRRTWNAVAQNLDSLYINPSYNIKRYTTTSAHVTTTSWARIGELGFTVDLDHPAHIIYTADISVTASATPSIVEFRLLFDGVSYPLNDAYQHRFRSHTTAIQTLSFAGFLPVVSEGRHIIDFYWRHVGAGAFTISTSYEYNIAWWEVRI